MNRRTSRLLYLFLILALVQSACGLTPNSASNDNESKIKTSVAATVQAVQPARPVEEMVAIRTGSPQMGAVSVSKDGQILAALTDSDAEGHILRVRGGVWRAPNGMSAVFYNGEDGLPAKGIVPGAVVYLSNYRADRVDVTIYTDNGSKIIQNDVQVDAVKLQKLRSLAGRYKLAAPYAEELSTSEALQLAGIAFGVFSCAATFASGGTLSLVFGIGCASTLIAIWSSLQPENQPVLDGLGIGGDAISCGSGLAERSPIAVADCASLLTDLASQATATAEQTEQQITSPGAVTTEPPAVDQTAAPVTIFEDFIRPDDFQSTTSNVSIANGQVNWHVSRSGGEQFVYRSIPAFSGDVRLTVVGQVDNYTNNCAVRAGIGSGYLTGIAVNFGFTGGGCGTNGPVITTTGASMNAGERSCNFFGNWMWIEKGRTYQAEMVVRGDQVTLSVPGIGSDSGTLIDQVEYNTLYVGLKGDGDWPECSGVIESITVEPLP